MLVVRALYGLKSVSAAFRSHLANCMRQLGYESNKADSDLWMKVCTWDSGNGPEKFYSYIYLYVDNILCIHNNPNALLTQIDNYFPLKPDLVGEPDVYLGAKLRLMQFENGIWAWGLSLSKHVQEAICGRKLAEVL